MSWCAWCADVRCMHTLKHPVMVPASNSEVTSYKRARPAYAANQPKDTMSHFSWQAAFCLQGWFCVGQCAFQVTGALSPHPSSTSWLPYLTPAFMLFAHYQCATWEDAGCSWPYKLESTCCAKRMSGSDVQCHKMRHQASMAAVPTTPTLLFDSTDSYRSNHREYTEIWCYKMQQIRTGYKGRRARAQWTYILTFTVLKCKCHI